MQGVTTSPSATPLAPDTPLGGPDAPSQPAARFPGRAPVLRGELLALLGLVAAAFCLRAWKIGAVALGQYDEGVYAFSGWALADPTQELPLWPGQERYAPPVYFTLVSLAFRLAGGAVDTAAIWVNVVLGTLTVPALWWVARRWFGAPAALFAAGVLAFSEFHIVMSRSALTDVAFALTFLLGIAAMANALERGGLWRAVLAGLATGLAWNTKYHGWFVPLIGAGAVAGAVWFGGVRDRLRQWVGTLVVTTVVGMLVYLPWLLHVRSQPGSVGGWANYFASMLSPRWPRRFLAHVLQQGYLEGSLTRISVVIGVALVISVLGGALAGRRGAALLAGVAAAAATLGGMAATMLLALAAVPALLRQRREILPWMLLGWLALWVAAAPLYRPYFRLLLPLLLVAAVLAGVAAAALIVPAGGRSGGDRTRRDLATVALMAGFVLVAARWHDDPSNPWREGVGARVSADRISAAIGTGAPVTVIGEPPVAFYLRRLGHPVFGDITSPQMLDTLSAPRFIVAGMYARGTRGLREGLAARGQALQPMGRVPMRPTEIRLLDDLPARAAKAYRAAPDSRFDLDLYALRSLDRLP